MNTLQSASLFFRDETADKVYHLQLEGSIADGFTVNAQWGRRGSTLQTGTKCSNVSQAEAQKVYDRTLHEKLGKGYQAQLIAARGPVAVPGPIRRSTADEQALQDELRAALRTPFPVELLEEITEAEALRFAHNADYVLQEKRDGHRRQIQKRGLIIVSFNRKGQPVPLPAAIHAAMGWLPDCFLDGELEGDHFVAFDLLDMNGRDLSEQTYERRYKFLKALHFGDRAITPVGTWDGDQLKLEAFLKLAGERAEGVVFKLKNAPYRPGRNGQHKKFKFLKSCTVKVTAIRPKGKESITVAVRNGKTWLDIGTCSTIGKELPKLGDVVEVRYLYATEAKRLYQARLLQIRDDVGLEACTIGQLQYRQGVTQPEAL